MMRSIAQLVSLACLLMCSAHALAQGGAEGDIFFETRAYLKASNTESSDSFGNAVAASGTTLVVAAVGEASAATGINGDQDLVGAPGSGAVYIFEKLGLDWSQQTYIKSSNSNFGDFFGTSLALAGDTLVVGAPQEDSSASGVNGNQFSNSSTHAGAVYVFVRAGDSWTQQAYLKASNTGTEDQFGVSVAIWGDTIVVGANMEDSDAAGVNGPQNNDNAEDSGAVYIFVRDGSTWTQQAYLKSSNSEAGDDFGSSVSLHGDTLVVGASGEDSDSTEIDTSPENNDAFQAGAAYVFARNGTTWTQQAYLKASNTETLDSFGTAVAISEDTLLVGASGEDSQGSGVSVNPSSNSTSASGAAYVFVRSGANWSQQAFLKSSPSGTSIKFGSSLDITEDTAVVGAPFYGVGSLPNRGLATVFQRSAGAWSVIDSLSASNAGDNDQFATSLAMSRSGFTIVAGAKREDSDATGLNGNQVSDAAPNAGAAYLFTNPNLEPWADEGCALAGISGDPKLTGIGSLLSFSENAVTLEQAAGNATAALFIAPLSTPVPFKGGLLKPFPFLPLHLFTTTPSGTFTIPFVMQPGVPAGTELWVQWGIEDAAALRGVSLSNAIMRVTP